MLGEIDAVEIDAELADRRAPAPQPCRRAAASGLAFPLRDRRHRDGGDHEAIGHRPLRRDHAELVADDDPGRSPDQVKTMNGSVTDRRRVAALRLVTARRSPRRAASTAGHVLVPAGHQPDFARRPVVEIEALRRAARAASSARHAQEQSHWPRPDRPAARRAASASACAAALAARALSSHKSFSSIARICAAR